MLRLLASFLAVLMLVSPSFGAIAHVQTAQNSHFVSQGSLAKAYTSNVTSGSLLILCIETASGITVSSVADGANTWIRAASANGGGSGNRFELWYAWNAASGATTATATYSASASFGGMTIHEYSGLDTTSNVIDQVLVNDQTNPGTGTDAVTTGADTTTSADELIYGCSGNYVGGTVTETEGTGYTCRSALFGACGGGGDSNVEDKIVSSAGSYSATWTASGAGGAAADFVSILATFRAPRTDSACQRLLEENSVDYLLQEDASSYFLLEDSTCGAVTAVPTRLLIGIGL